MLVGGDGIDGEANAILGKQVRRRTLVLNVNLKRLLLPPLHHFDLAGFYLILCGNSCSRGQGGLRLARSFIRETALNVTILAFLT